MTTPTDLAGIPIPEGLSVQTLATTDPARTFVMFDKGEMSPEDQQQLEAMLSQISSVQSDVDAWAKIVLDSWNDPTLRAKVEADPSAVLAQYGYDLPSVASTITSSFQDIAKLITAGSYLAGLAFSIGAIMKFKSHKDNPTQIPIGTPIALVFVAAALLFLPSILGVAGATMFGSSGGTTAGPEGTVFK